MISSKDVRIIYQNFIKNKFGRHKNKYSELPLHLNDDEKWKWEGKDFPRVISLLEFKDFIKSNSLEFSNVCVLNGGKYEPEMRYIKSKSLICCDYEKDQENYDLLKLNLPSKDFDLIVCNHTLEHVQNPSLAVKNIYSHVAYGGWVYASVPVVSPPHNCPFHFYTGITPTGLGCMFKSANFEIIDIGFWGNSEYSSHILGPPRYDKLPFPDYTIIQNYQNDFDRPVVAWIFARKGD